MLIGTVRLKKGQIGGEVTLFTNKYIVTGIVFEGETPNEYQLYTKENRDGNQMLDLITQELLLNIIRTDRPIYIGLDKSLKEDTQVFILGEDLSNG